MTWTPHVTTAVVCQNQGGQFLMVEEVIDGHVLLNQPAGHIEANERIVDAAIRETMEETGWAVKITHYLGLYVYHASTNGVTYHRHCFIAQPLQRKTENLDQDILRAVWLDASAIYKADNLRSPLVRQCIADYQKGTRFPLDILHE